MMRRILAALTVCATCGVILPPAYAQDSQADAAREVAERLRQAQAALVAAARSMEARPQRFSVVLIVSSVLTDPPSDNIPPHARKALEDMKSFLPFKSYRLLGTTEVASVRGQPATARVTGGDNQTFEITIARDAPALVQGGSPAGTNGRAPLSLTFILNDVSDAAGRAGFDLRNAMNTLVTMDVGETIVVGTSRVRGSRGLLALLTALPSAN